MMYVWSRQHGSAKRSLQPDESCDRRASLQDLEVWLQLVEQEGGEIIIHVRSPFMTIQTHLRNLSSSPWKSDFEPARGGFRWFGGVFLVVTDLKSFRSDTCELLNSSLKSDAALSKCMHVILNHEGAAERKRKTPRNVGSTKSTL
jgi:hypothetical protein